MNQSLNPLSFDGRGRTVLVVQRRLPHYRVPFFEALSVRLEKQNLNFKLAHGDATEEEMLKNDAGHYPSAIKVPTHYYFNGNVCWQAFGSLMKGADLTVFTPENKLIYNLIPQFLDKKTRLGFWGHGANFQGNADSLKERYKKIIARQIDWWFAYTALSVPLVQSSGFPTDRITVLNNSIDTVELSALVAAFNADKKLRFFEQHGLAGHNVGVYVGSLYADKRIDFLLESALAIRRLVPDFELVVVGAGALKPEVEAFASRHPWVKVLGMLRGADKVSAICASKIMLNPGLVGLGILDSFVCGTPLVTTDCGLHSPEIAYLENGRNGEMTANTVTDFSQACARLLRESSLLSGLAKGCRDSAQKYTIDNMANNFVDGVVRCLEAPIYR
ncbi:MAG: glycosyltransferase [Rubrivivax sp.]|nr:MAG: glycosyltransferase [Rubrivivax sp.]